MAGHRWKQFCLPGSFSSRPFEELSGYETSDSTFFPVLFKPLIGIASGLLWKAKLWLGGSHSVRPALLHLEWAARETGSQRGHEQSLWGTWRTGLYLSMMWLYLSMMWQMTTKRQTPCSSWGFTWKSDFVLSSLGTGMLRQKLTACMLSHQAPCFEDSGRGKYWDKAAHVC